MRCGVSARRRWWRALLPLLALGSVGVAHALTLGEISVHSTLGQPFVADIPITLNAGESLRDVRVRLAARSDYRRLKLSYERTLSQLSIGVQRNVAGRAQIQIRSRSPMSKSPLDILLDVRWSGGRLVREYVALLGVAPLPPVLPAKSAAGRPAVPAARTPAAAEPVMYGPVKRGEILSEIARRYKPQGVSTPQMTVAIYQANHQAFIDGNMNRLRRGVSLFLPSDQAARAVTQHEAATVIRAQSAPVRSPAAGTGSASSTLQILAPVTPTALPPGTEAGDLQRRLDQLRRTNSEVRAENQQLRAQLARLEQQTRLLAAKVLALPAPVRSAAPAAVPASSRQSVRPSPKPAGTVTPPAAKSWWREPLWWAVIIAVLLCIGILLSWSLFLRHRPSRYLDLPQVTKGDQSVQLVWRGRF